MCSGGKDDNRETGDAEFANRLMPQFLERLKNVTRAAIARKGFLLSRYDHAHRQERLAMVRRVAEERALLLSDGEACQLLACVDATCSIPGDLAELGVAYGASAKLLSMLLPPPRICTYLIRLRACRR